MEIQRFVTKSPPYTNRAYEKWCNRPHITCGSQNGVDNRLLQINLGNGYDVRKIDPLRVMCVDK